MTAPIGRDSTIIFIRRCNNQLINIYCYNPWLTPDPKYITSVSILKKQFSTVLQKLAKK